MKQTPLVNKKIQIKTSKGGHELNRAVYFLVMCSRVLCGKHARAANIPVRHGYLCGQHACTAR